MKIVPLVLALCVVLPAQNQDATLTNGVNGYLDVPANASLSPPAAMTLEAWVFFNNVGLNPTTLYPTIARKNIANSQEEYFLRVEGTGVLRWKIKIGATTSIGVNSPTAMPGNVWTHVAGTYDGLTARLYLNGIQVAQGGGVTPGAPFNGGGALRIGKGDDQLGVPSEVWSGKLDEVRIWSVARTAAEIQGSMGFQIGAVPNLVSSWRMSGSGADAIGPNNGNVIGTVTFGPSTLALNPGPGPWQTNHAAIGLDIDGVSSDGYSAGIVTRAFTTCGPANAVVNVGFAPANLWDLVVTVGPGVALGSGGILTPGGQIVNLNVADPSLTFLFAPGSGPSVSAISFPVSFNSGLVAAAQGIVLDPLSPDGFTLSSLVELHAVPGAVSVPGPTGDDSVVTVSLANPALCGAPASIPFFGVNYAQFDVSSNGRVMFGSPTPNTAFTPSAATALTSYPFVGAWCDLAPNVGGTITVSVPTTGIVRVDWNAVRYYNLAQTVTFGIQFDGVTGAVQIDGLGGIAPAAVNQFLGITAGILGPATNPGATTFIAGGPFTPPSPYSMIYAFGTAGSLSTGLSAIVFVPSVSGGYDWGAF